MERAVVCRAFGVSMVDARRLTVAEWRAMVDVLDRERRRG